MAFRRLRLDAEDDERRILIEHIEKRERRRIDNTIRTGQGDGSRHHKCGRQRRADMHDIESMDIGTTNFSSGAAEIASGV